jgi:tetratricopeptide (TPR) repeat protein
MPEWPPNAGRAESAPAEQTQPGTEASPVPPAQNDPAAQKEQPSGGKSAISLIPGPEPVLEVAPSRPQRPAPERRELTAADLDAIRWRLDGGTLREVVDDKQALRELGEKLDEPLADDAGNVAKAGLLSVRAEVYRLLGELGMAAAASRLALAHAESAKDTQSMVIAQAELAHVLRLRGDFVEADRLFGRAANAPVPARLRSVVHENAGRCCFDQGRHMEALDHFARAVRLGRPDDTDLAERIGVCLEAVYIHVLRDGWGPYPRMDGLDEATAEQPTLR